MRNLSRRAPPLAFLLSLVVISAALISFYLWTGQTPATEYTFKAAKAGYYRLLADAFLDGHTYLRSPPHPDVLAAKNVYDPEVNGRLPKLHDASLYKEKYYLYFGPAPAIILFLPFRLLTGLSFPDSLAVAIFCSCGFLINLALVLRLVRDHGAQLSLLKRLGLVLAVGMGTMVPVMIRRASVWEVPISTGYFLVSAGFFCCYLGLTLPRRRYRWLALASLSFGLAIACRPTFVFGALFYCGTLFFWRPDHGKRLRLGRWILICLPIGAIVLGLLAYNYARFENLLEFGTKYQLAGLDMYHARMMSRLYVPINFWYYDLAPAQFEPFFPFFEVVGDAPLQAPKGYFGIENVYGMFPNLPFVLVGLAAVTAAWRARRQNPAFTFFIIILAGFAVVMHAVLLCFAGAANRYMVDFVPWFVLLAVIGVISGEGEAASSPFRLIVFRLIWVLTLGWTLLFNLFVSFQHNSLLEANDPAGYARLAKFFNHVCPILDKFTQSEYGPINIQLRLPRDRRGQLEPLIVAGRSYKMDYIYIYYTDSNHIQLGFEHTSYGGFVTEPIPVDYAQSQNIRVEMGALYPPATHPFFKDLSEEKIAERKQFVRIWLNGVPYANRHLACYEVAAKDIDVGLNRHSMAFGKRFSGTLEMISRSMQNPAAREIGANDRVEIALRFPTNRLNAAEPLVVTGVTGRGDLLYVTYLSDHRVKFSLDHWGYSLAVSAPVTVAPERIHLLAITLPNLHVEPRSDYPSSGRPGHFEITLDHDVVFSGEAQFHPAGKGHVYILKNPIGGSVAGPEFTGEVLKEISPAIAHSVGD